MMDNIVTYKNGNYRVFLDLRDGTMIRATKDDYLSPKFPDSMDVKITNRCSKGCPWCHERSTKEGHHADWYTLYNWLKRLPAYTQIAFGGGNVLEYPNFSALLGHCKDFRLVPSITVNQEHFLNNLSVMRHWTETQHIYGLGVSLTEATEELIKNIQEFPNAVIHVIAGLVTIEELKRLSKNGLKILILGYKHFGRGIDFGDKNNENILYNINKLNEYLPIMIQDGWFDNISFDNLALKQLDVRGVLSEAEWNQFYMGDDGISTMYVDMVSKQFARSSTSTMRYPLLSGDIYKMMEVIHKERE